MQIVLSTIGKFHTFDLARELQRHGALRAIFSAYPRFKLRNENLPATAVHTFPWIHAPYMGFPYRRFLGRRGIRLWEYVDKKTFDRFVSRRIPACDIFVGLSGSALNSGKAAQQGGARYVCDRGSSHICVQDRLLREEYSLWDLAFDGIDPRVIDLELAEYAAADCITVPSTFSLNSFISQGISPAKLERISYGVNLERFHPTVPPEPGKFDVLFVGGMSLRKGIQYLLQAYTKIRHQGKSLTFAGSFDPTFIALMKKRSLWPQDARVLGHVPQQALKELMSRSHVMVLPSIEEGLAMVQAQAMACGCPVIASEHTGAEDLFSDDQEGFIVPIRRPDEIADRLQLLADSPALRARLSQACIARMRRLGGWREYGDHALRTYSRLMTSAPPAAAQLAPTLPL